MPKESLKEPYASIEHDAIDTMLQGGLHRWRPDLDFPESYSDMQACFRGLFTMFEVKRRTRPFDIKDAWNDETRSAWNEQERNRLNREAK